MQQLSAHCAVDCVQNAELAKEFHATVTKCQSELATIHTG